MYNNLKQGIMKTNHLFLVMLAGMTFAACTSEDLSGSSPTSGDEKPIMFSSMSQGFTRGNFEGSDAAMKLGNKFVVSAKKGSSTAATEADVTFDNYVVEYAENTAHTTASNVANWEYVGKGRIKHAIDNGITSQTIKYWDYSKPQYDFIAWSAGSKTPIYEGTPTDGQVLVSSLNPNATATGAVTFTGSAADLSEVYISDLVTVKKADYQNTVTMKFRSLGTKVRIAIYETVPGYSVKDVKFYTAANVALAGDATDNTPRLFTTTANDIYTSGTYTVTYPTVDTPASKDNNQAHVTFVGDGAQSTVVDFGNLNYTIAEEGEHTLGKAFLGRTSATASFAGNAKDNYYTAYIPNETGTNLNLRVNFTLEAIDGGGEIIKVEGATAQVPSIYTTWQPGYAYTYIFKISDKTNGYTGAYDPTKPDDTTVNSDPAGLYPITFDAVVVNAEDNDKTQETITTVSTPSITTYQKGSNVVNNNEYRAATGPIYVTVNDGTTESTPDLANGALQDLTDKAKLYTIPSNKTEAEVIDALQMQDDDAADGTVKGRSGLVLTEKTMELTNTVEYGVDGNTITIPADGDKKKAAKFTAADAGTYAFVYTKTAPTLTTDKFQAVTKTAGTSVSGLYRYALVSAPTGDVQKGVKYFPNNTATAGTQNVFIGQGVGNLYLDNAGNNIASGYAVTGTTYYYTIDNGMTYKAAHNVAYASFGNTLFVESTPGTYVANTDATPQDGTAYYYYDTEINKYIYCVILPERTDGKYVIDETAAKVACGSTDTAVKGMTYFDKYTQNNGVYYTKVIKVQ